MSEVSKTNDVAISIPASETSELIYKYQIHAHPDEKIYRAYNYKKTKYFTFRESGGIMKKIYTLQQSIYINPDNIEGLNNYNLKDSVKDRIIGYILDRKKSCGFDRKDTAYKFYILKYEDELSHNPRKPGQNNHCYFALEVLKGEEEYPQPLNSKNIIEYNNIVEGDGGNKNDEYWTFFSNPKFWYVDDFLNSEKSEHEFYYSISAYHKNKIMIGHKGVIRVGKDSRTKVQLNSKKKLESGIYAIVEITSNAEFKKDDDCEFYANKEDAEKDKWRVRLKVTKNLITDPLIFNESTSGILKKDKYLIRGHMASTMPLLKETFYDAILLINPSKNAFKYNDVIGDLNLEFGDTLPGIKVLNKIYENLDIKKKERLIKIVERGYIATRYKELMGFKCQICEALGKNPYSFKKKNGEYYSEAHHIIPVNNVEETKLSIDNLISVCPNHHRQIHYGNSEVVVNNQDYVEFMIDEELVKINKVKIDEELLINKK